MVTKKFKRVIATFLAFAIVLAVPAGVLGRDQTYVWINGFNDVPIPDAFQFRESVYLRQVVGDIPVDGVYRQVTRVGDMFISRETQWTYITEIELDAIIVLNERHELVPCPRTGDPVIRWFTISQEVLNRTFEGMYPDDIHTAESIQARRDAFVQVRCGVCENCVLMAVHVDEEYDEEYFSYTEYDEHDEYDEAAEVEAVDEADIEALDDVEAADDIEEDEAEEDEDEQEEEIEEIEEIEEVYYPCIGEYYFITDMSRPEGIFVDEDGTFFVADTRNNRVFVATPDLEITLVIYMPSSRDLAGVRLGAFLPIAVVADSGGRISVVAQNINDGILQFSDTGQFNRFIGAPTVIMSAWDRFLRQWFRSDQLTGAQNHVPTEFNNIRIDEQNFIWGTIGTVSDIPDAVANPTSDSRAIKRINPLGSDILIRRGDRGIFGDMGMSPTATGLAGSSRIVDVGVGPAGTYTLLDQVRGRMFTFNAEGIMLFAFGNMGTARGNFNHPVAIGYMGYNIAVLDSGLNEIIIFEPTLYGELVISAERYFMEGRYDYAYRAWALAAEQNANFAHAFFGLGDARFNDREFEAALAYFIHAGGARGREGYSRARDMMRRDQMERVFPIMSLVVGIGALALVGYLIFKGVKNYALSDDIIGYNRNEGDDE